MGKFKVVSPFEPQGDQPQAIESLSEGVLSGDGVQVLLGVTGSGKTFTLAKLIEHVQKPTLVIAHNKTLAAQLCSEFREFFPDNAVEYFVSYYDYYQPEAYIAVSDTYIEKTADINQEIDRLRHSATCSLNERRDVIIVASVSCIYALGDPEEYLRMSISVRKGAVIERDAFIRKLIDIQYQRNDFEFVRGTFRVRGDVIEIFPMNFSDRAIRIDFFCDEVESIKEINAVTGVPINSLMHTVIFPATHYSAGREKLELALEQIENDMIRRVDELKSQGKLVEAQRLEQRTRYDIEMIREIGYCTGIENYSRYFDGREPGQAPYTLLDFFGDDFLTIIDESHVTLPQIRAMYNGDRARKTELVEYGFRIPSAYDNRPLKFDEFESRVKQLICVSATPAEYELSRAANIAEQIIRPTGLVDPEIFVRPATDQIDDLIIEINRNTQKGYRVLVTTLTKRMAEMLTEHLDSIGIKVRYMHSDIQTIERMKIIRDLRLGEFDVLVGINLLREGLDLPEVGLVAILDADKEGFLRSTTSMIQTVGRAARNVDGYVIMYADTVTDSMRRTIDETSRRRNKQIDFNKVHGIVPRSIIKHVHGIIEISSVSVDVKDCLSAAELEQKIALITEQMQKAAMELEFETAAKLRDELYKLKGIEVSGSTSAEPGTPGSRRKSRGRTRK
ncbi:MAG: excinuclease ABC subunit UvrB [Clostridia bacterium]|nr:excinuclease ABC subunit UvrB [Clostridia bacterium]